MDTNGNNPGLSLHEGQRTPDSPLPSLSQSYSTQPFPNDSWRVYSLFFHILDGVRKRLIPGLRKEEDNKTSEDGEVSIGDPGQVGSVYC